MKQAEVKEVMDAVFSLDDLELLDRGKHLTAQCRTEQKTAKQNTMKEVYKQEISNGDDFDFVKIHLLAHLAETIQAIANLPFHSTDCLRQCHNIMLKDAMPHCNYVMGFRKQILNYNNSLHSLNLRTLNLLQLIQKNRNIFPADVQHALGM
jgi:hypothetical protein